MKLLVFMISLLLWANVCFSQDDFSIAPDFTITTTDGITRNLYNTLDSGKTVLVDLFYTTCYYCQLYSPVIEEVYQATGAGEGDVEVWGISNNLFDTNWVIDQYKENYNVSNPCAGPWGGGLQAFSRIIEGQNFYGFPTYCVICPDRNMYFDICYPPVAGCFYPLFEDCTVGIEDEQPIPEETGLVSIYPNPANDMVSLEIRLKSTCSVTVEVVNVLGQIVCLQLFEIRQPDQTLFLPIEDLSNGTYFIRLLHNNQSIDARKLLISGN